MEENQIFQLAENKNPITFAKVLAMIVGIPFSILGIIHCYVPYILVKRHVEKSFKRRVFWSSVKLLLGGLAMWVWNIPLVILMHYFIFKPLLSDFTQYTVLFSLLYYIITPLLGLVAYKSYHLLKSAKDLKVVKQMNFQPFIAERASLIQRIKEVYS